MINSYLDFVCGCGGLPFRFQDLAFLKEIRIRGKKTNPLSNITSIFALK